MAQSDAAQDITVTGADAHGQEQTFKHPAVQSAMMFLGEFLCLVPFFIHYWRSTAGSGGSSELMHVECMRRSTLGNAARLDHHATAFVHLHYTSISYLHCHRLLCWQACNCFSESTAAYAS